MTQEPTARQTAGIGLSADRHPEYATDAAMKATSGRRVQLGGLREQMLAVSPGRRGLTSPERALAPVALDTVEHRRIRYLDASDRPVQSGVRGSPTADLDIGELGHRRSPGHRGGDLEIRDHRGVGVVAILGVELVELAASALLHRRPEGFEVRLIGDPRRRS